jgi:hypothetical protein
MLAWSSSRGVLARLLIGIVVLSAFFASLPASAQLLGQTIYDDRLENGWQDWGWVATNLANTAPVYSGGYSISVSIGSQDWGGLFLHSGADFDSSPYSSISFWVNGGPTGGQMLQLRPILGGNAAGTFEFGPLPANNTWEQITIPLAAIGAAEQPNFDGIMIQDATGNGGEPTFYLDGISLNASDEVVYNDALGSGWQNDSWAQTSIGGSGRVYGASAAINTTIASPWQALYLYHPGFDTAGLSALQFWINGGSSGGQKLRVASFVGGAASKTSYVLPALAANTWLEVTVPLSAIGAANVDDCDGFFIQDAIGAAQPTFIVDSATLLANQIQSVSIKVDPTANRAPISPLVYGVALGYPDIYPPVDPRELSDLNVPLDRQGGDNTSTYNWLINARSNAADWYFESVPDSSATPGATADQFVTDTTANGAAPMLTIPMLSWVANLGPNRSELDSFSVAKYGAQEATDPYWPDAGDGIYANGSYVQNDPTDAYVPANLAYQQAWVSHLLSTWGPAASGGVPYYIMDNEVSIWFSTHRDIHPVGPTMDEIYNDIVSYASMVKAADPTAQVVAPEEWGWNGYFYSGYDQQWAAQNGWNFNEAPDRVAHDGADYLPWLLQQLNAYQQSTGKRLLDVFTVHFYPGGPEFGSDTSDSTEDLRNRSTRQLWDPGYVAESWIDSTVDLVPRVKGWVDTYYPGTKTGITEYNWGGDASMNGATTQADILGILGRQGLDLATRWQVPDPSTPTYQAMKIWRNYDGAKSTFGDTSIADNTNTNPDGLSSYAAIRSSDGAMTVMIIDKVLYGASAPVTVKLANFRAAGVAHAWQISGTGTAIDQLADIPVSASSIVLTVPAQSITLLVIPADTAPPVTTASLTGNAGNAGWYRGKVTVTLNASDTGGPGVKSTHYKIDGGPELAYKSAFTVAGNAKHSVSFWSVDKAGNAETAHVAPIDIDTEPPVSSASVSGGIAPATVTISATDNLSGVATTYDELDGATQIYTQPIVISTTGNTKIKYWSVDIAGNVEAARTIKVSLIKSIP